MPLPFPLLSIMSFVSHCFQLPIFSLSFCTRLLHSAPRDISQHRAVFLTNPASVRLDRAVYSQLGQWVLLEEETPAPDCPELGREGGSSFCAGEGSGVCSVLVFSLQRSPGRNIAIELS